VLYAKAKAAGSLDPSSLQRFLDTVLQRFESKGLIVKERDESGSFSSMCVCVSVCLSIYLPACLPACPLTCTQDFWTATAGM
jgi:hypothetical protein